MSEKAGGAEGLGITRGCHHCAASITVCSTVGGCVVADRWWWVGGDLVGACGRKEAKREPWWCSGDAARSATQGKIGDAGQEGKLGTPVRIVVRGVVVVVVS